METIHNIIPSAPFKDYAAIETIAKKGGNSFDYIQVDICDGKFVKNVSWPFTETSRAEFEKIAERGDDVFLPNWEQVSYSADLMVEHPEKLIDSLVAYGFSEIIVHYRSIEKNIEVFQEITAAAEKYELSLVIAVDVKTDQKEFLQFLKKNSAKISGVQVMGIENIGFQGQKFADESLEIVKGLRKNFPDTVVYFDGGINDENILEIANAGVDIFCVGSYVTGSRNVNASIKELKTILEV